MPAWLELLGDTERAKFARFHFDRDKALYAAAHALVRTTLARYVPVAPAQLRFVIGAHGKPCLDHAGDVRFSLSHAHGLTACLVVRGADPGIDVEQLGHVERPLEIAGRYFAASEVAALAGLSGEAMSERFLATWTLKEACVKATGAGLSQALDRFAFDVGAKTIRLSHPDAGEAARWQFALWRAAPSHVVAAAIRREPSIPTATPLKVYRTVPLGQDVAAAGLDEIASSPGVTKGAD